MKIKIGIKFLCSVYFLLFLIMVFGCSTPGQKNIKNGDIYNELNYLISKLVELEDVCADLYGTSYDERRFEQLVLYKRMPELSEEVDVLLREKKINKQEKKEIFTRIFSASGVPMFVINKINDRDIDCLAYELIAANEARPTKLWSIRYDLVKNSDPDNPILQFFQ